MGGGLDPWRFKKGWIGEDHGCDGELSVRDDVDGVVGEVGMIWILFLTSCSFVITTQDMEDSYPFIRPFYTRAPSCGL